MHAGPPANLPFITFQRTTYMVQPMKTSGPPAKRTAVSAAGVCAPVSSGAMGPKLCHHSDGLKIDASPNATCEKPA